MNKSTPGPWHIIGGYNIYSELGGQSGDGTTADAQDGWHIASIGEAPTFVDGESVYLGREVQSANARLLASAPDLLEALEGLLASFEAALIDEWSEPRESWGKGGTWHTDWHDNGLKAIAAIAKAKGEA